MNELMNEMAELVNELTADFEELKKKLHVS
jgi:hypothetical protein